MLLARELLLDQALDEGLKRHTIPGQDKVAGFVGPVEFEAGGEGGDPDLADRGVGRDDEFCAGFFKEDVEHAILFFDFESAVLFGSQKGLFQGFERPVGMIAESSFVEHTEPVYRWIPGEL